VHLREALPYSSLFGADYLILLRAVGLWVNPTPDRNSSPSCFPSIVRVDSALFFFSTLLCGSLLPFPPTYEAHISPPLISPLNILPPHQARS